MTDLQKRSKKIIIQCIADSSLHDVIEKRLMSEGIFEVTGLNLTSLLNNLTLLSIKVIITDERLLNQIDNDFYDEIIELKDIKTKKELVSRLKKLDRDYDGYVSDLFHDAFALEASEISDTNVLAEYFTKKMMILTLQRLRTSMKAKYNNFMKCMNKHS